jgi:hypothetical protein
MVEGTVGNPPTWFAGVQSLSLKGGDLSLQNFFKRSVTPLGVVDLSLKVSRHDGERLIEGLRRLFEDLAVSISPDTLKRLHIDGVSWSAPELDEEIFQPLFSFRHMQHVTLVLTLQPQASVPESCLTKMAEVWPALRHLDFYTNWSADSVSEAAVDRIFEMCPSMEFLRAGSQVLKPSTNR